METINNLANTAAKAVWGESNNATTTAADNNNTETVQPGTEATNNETKGIEPVSGKLGDVSKGEPFDAGNMEAGATTTKDTRQTEAIPADNPSTTSLAGVTIDDTSAAGGQAKGPTSEYPSTTGDTGGFKAAQADIRDPASNSTTDPRTEAARKNVDDTGDLDQSENPDKVDGPGPKPIDEVAHERGGDAGVVPAAEGSRDTGAAAGAAGGEVDGPGAASTGEGTGEQYVKSSGLAADGGDFDATKPGAGREADRLLGDKGYVNPAVAAAESKTAEEEDKHTSAEKVSTDKASAGSGDSKEKKPGLKEKIKAKLHKH